VLALSGLEDKIRPKTQRQRDKEKTNVVIYADDFIVTAASADLLKEKVMPKLRIPTNSISHSSFIRSPIPFLIDR